MKWFINDDELIYWQRWIDLLTTMKWFINDDELIYWQRWIDSLTTMNWFTDNDGLIYWQRWIYFLTTMNLFTLIMVNWYTVGRRTLIEQKGYTIKQAFCIDYFYGNSLVNTKFAEAVVQFFLEHMGFPVPEQFKLKPCLSLNLPNDTRLYIDYWSYT